MKKLLFITLISLFFISCFAKNNKEITTTSQVPVKFREKQQYGLFNPVTKEVIAQPKYTYIEKYSDGFCLGVIGEEGGLCDVIDSNGNIIFSYETEPLSKTYCFNGIFSFIYDDGIQYYHGLYDSKGKIFFKCDFIYNMNEECIVTKKNKDYIFLFYDENGFKNKKIKLKDTYDYEPFKNGYSRFYVIENDEKKYGIIREDKKIIINAEFRSLGKEFVNNYIIAETNESLYGLLSKDGKWKIKPKYTKIYNYNNKVLAVKEKNWIFIDIDENIILELDDNITIQTDFFNDIAIYSKYDSSNMKYGLIDVDGNIVLNPICDKIEPNPDNGFWQVFVNNKWMLFKQDEGLINPEEYLDFSKIAR